MFVNVYRRLIPHFGYISLARSFHRSSRWHGLTTFYLSDIGEGISEVELVKWDKQVGDYVEEMENVCTVQSDKAAVEITSRFTGVVKKLHCDVGDIVPIGKALMDIEVEDDPVDEPPKKTFDPSVKSSKKTTDAPEVPPGVRKRAKELNVDLSKVTPTGPNGRITLSDVENFVSEESSVVTGGLSPDKVRFTAIGSAMVKSMVASVAVPHVTVGEDLDLTNVVALYRNRKAQDSTLKLTITSYILKALSLALKSYPILNSKFDGDGYLQFVEHNISIAINTPHGLLVPNIKNVQNLSIREIQSELNRLQKDALDRKLAAADITGGTCTLSNLGAIGGTYVAARLFDGQACIIALGASRLRPQYVNDGDELKLVPRSIAPMGVTADHRHIDGATMAQFANEFKRLLENPEELDAHF